MGVKMKEEMLQAERFFKGSTTYNFIISRVNPANQTYPSPPPPALYIYVQHSALLCIHINVLIMHVEA